ncbi:MAG: DNA-3-methyladenine glycosylase 2 family protein [Planctomycetota bacterium]
MKSITLDRESLVHHAEALAQADPMMRRALDVGGRPKLWKRPVTFETFIRTILEQQVSLSSAWSTHSKLKQACPNKRVSPKAVRTLGQDGLRQLGFSRQKARYADTLAAECLAGRFPIRHLADKEDDQVREQITSQLGLGDWSADMILMLSLCRSDVFPVGDLALVNGAVDLGDESLRDRETLLQRSQDWRPFRSVATRMIWAYYLQSRKKKIPGT